MPPRVSQYSPLRLTLACGWTLLVCLLLLQPGRDPLIGPAAAGDHSPPVALLLNLGHLVAFAVMTWLWWRALGATGPALRIALPCGVLSELAQALVPDRSLSVLDLTLNALGALAVAAWLRRRGKSP